MKHRTIATALSKLACELLVAHVDGDWTWHLVRGNDNKRQCMSHLRRVGLIRHGPWGTATQLTEDGRMVLGFVLGDAADLLVRAGALGHRQRAMVDTFLRVVAKEPERHREPA